MIGVLTTIARRAGMAAAARAFDAGQTVPAIAEAQESVREYGVDVERELAAREQPGGAGS